MKILQVIKFVLGSLVLLNALFVLSKKLMSTEVNDAYSTGYLVGYVMGNLIVSALAIWLIRSGWKGMMKKKE